jgi:hypothetical protein
MRGDQHEGKPGTKHQHQQVNVASYYYYAWHIYAAPLTLATRSVFARQNTGIAGSNATGGMDACIVCFYSVFMLFCM